MRLAMGAVAAVATVAVAWPLASGATGSHRPQQAAPTSHGTGGAGLNIVNADYVVKSQPGGKILIELHNPKGALGLQADLRRAGIPATVLMPPSSCPTTLHGNRDNGHLQDLFRAYKGPHGHEWYIVDPSAIPRGDTLLIVPLDSHPTNGMSLSLERHVPSCVNPGLVTRSAP
jgi:hypothetical protein